MVIKSIIRIKNNMVLVFDAKGEQIPEYQGQYHDVKKSLLRDTPPGAVFAHWFNRADEPEIVSKGDW